MPTESSQRTFATRRRNIELGRHKCDECNKCFRSPDRLKTHMDGLIHHPERRVSYSCETCNYTTKFKAVHKRHTESQRHIRAMEN